MEVESSRTNCAKNAQKLKMKGLDSGLARIACIRLIFGAIRTARAATIVLGFTCMKNEKLKFG